METKLWNDGFQDPWTPHVFRKMLFKLLRQEWMCVKSRKAQCRVKIYRFFSLLETRDFREKKRVRKYEIREKKTVYRKKTDQISSDRVTSKAAKIWIRDAIGIEKAPQPSLASFGITLLALFAFKTTSISINSNKSSCSGLRCQIDHRFFSLNI